MSPWIWRGNTTPMFVCIAIQKENLFEKIPNEQEMYLIGFSARGICNNCAPIHIIRLITRGGTLFCVKTKLKGTSLPTVRYCSSSSSSSSSSLNFLWSEFYDNEQSCARTVGMDYTTIQNCVQGNEGRNLFIESINYTKSKGVQ
jgi:hypothetical protein